MLTSPKGLALIKEFESCKLTSYLDARGRGPKWTIGWGHTKNAKARQTITQEQADKWFEEDVEEVERALDKSLPEVVLNQKQLDALVSFTFNVGTHAFNKSTLRGYLLEGKFSEAAEQFPRWIYAGGRKLHGLRNRRKKERELFLA